MCSIKQLSQTSAAATHTLCIDLSSLHPLFHHWSSRVDIRYTYTPKNIATKRCVAYVHSTPAAGIKKGNPDTTIAFVAVSPMGPNQNSKAITFDFT